MPCFYCGGINPDNEYCTCSLATRRASIAQQRFMAARACNEDQVDVIIVRINEGLYLSKARSRSWNKD